MPQAGDRQAAPVQRASWRIPRRPALDDRDRGRANVDLDANLFEELDGDAPASPLEDLVDVTLGNDDPATLTPGTAPGERRSI
jgi:hypothetical protein